MVPARTDPCVGNACLGGTEHPKVEQGAGPSTVHALSAGQRDAAWLDPKKKEAQTTGVCLGFGFGASFWSCCGNLGCVPSEQLGESPVHHGVVSGVGCPSLLVGCRVVDVQLCPSVGMETCSSPAAPHRRAACAEMCTRARVGVQNGGERERRGQRWRKREAGTGGDFVPG